MERGTPLACLLTPEARQHLYPTEAPPRFELGVKVLQFHPGFCVGSRSLAMLSGDDT
jgi:hypothetical protein